MPKLDYYNDYHYGCSPLEELDVYNFPYLFENITLASAKTLQYAFRRDFTPYHEIDANNEALQSWALWRASQEIEIYVAFHKGKGRLSQSQKDDLIREAVWAADNAVDIALRVLVAAPALFYIKEVNLWSSLYEMFPLTVHSARKIVLTILKKRLDIYEKTPKDLRPKLHGVPPPRFLPEIPVLLEQTGNPRPLLDPQAPASPFPQFQNASIQSSISPQTHSSSPANECDDPSSMGGLHPC